MVALRYLGNIVTDTREYAPQEIARIQEMMKEHPVESTVKILRLLWMDDTKVKGASLYMECIWLWEGKTTSGTTEEPHSHDFSEVIGFIGTDPANPRDLGGRMEIVLGDETHFLTKSCLVHVPPGMKHCPLTFREVDRPVFFFTLAPISRYGRTPVGAGSPSKGKAAAFVPPLPDKSGSRYGRYMITEPASHAPSNPALRRPPPPPQQTAKTTHLVSLDSDVSPGGFYVDFVWIWSGDMTMAPEPHAHDFDEMIGIVGYPEDRRRPRVVGGDVSIALAGQRYPIKQSSLVYVPGGVLHCPIEFKDIRTPVLCFTIGNTPKWDLGTPEIKKAHGEKGVGE
jgi:mannose-6-phosphate isomerase-like protein (cupin superfamily)